MVSSLIVDELQPTATGIRFRSGPLVIDAACSERDRDELLAAGLPGEVAISISLDLVGHSLIPSCFAFASDARRGLFISLTKIKGIGKQSAVAVLDCGEVDDTLRAAVSKDDGYFAPVPGLGKAKIALVIAELTKGYQGMLPEAIEAPVAALVEAREALVSGGAPPLQAELELLAALEAAPTPPKSAEAWLALLS